jgi:hypothetical protein
VLVWIILLLPEQFEEARAWGGRERMRAIRTLAVQVHAPAAPPSKSPKTSSTTHVAWRSRQVFGLSGACPREHIY